MGRMFMSTVQVGENMTYRTPKWGEIMEFTKRSQEKQSDCDRKKMGEVPTWDWHRGSFLYSLSSLDFIKCVWDARILLDYKGCINHMTGGARVSIHISCKHTHPKLTHSNSLIALGGSTHIIEKLDSSTALVCMPQRERHRFQICLLLYEGQCWGSILERRDEMSFLMLDAVRTAHCGLPLWATWSMYNDLLFPFYTQPHQFQICLLQSALSFNVSAPYKWYLSALGSSEMGSKYGSWRTTDGTHFELDSPFIFHIEILCVQLPHV